MTSPLYAAWPATVSNDLRVALSAIRDRDLEQLGALAMHATMMAARPPLIYWTPATLRALRMVQRCREQGLPIWATMDAGPNLKLLFDARDEARVRACLPQVRVVNPWEQPEKARLSRVRAEMGL